MNKSQLIDAVASDSGLTKADSSRAIESLIGTVTKTLKKGDEVALARTSRKRAGDGARQRAGAPRLRLHPRVDARGELPRSDGCAARAGLARPGAVRLHRPRPRGVRVLPAHEGGDLPRDEDRRDLRRRRGAAVRADRAQHPAGERPRPLAPAGPRQPGPVAARCGALPPN